MQIRPYDDADEPAVRANNPFAVHQRRGQTLLAQASLLVAGGAHLALNCTGPEDLLTPARLTREIGPELVALADKLGTLLPPRAEAV